MSLLSNAVPKDLEAAAIAEAIFQGSSSCVSVSGNDGAEGGGRGTGVGFGGRGANASLWGSHTVRQFQHFVSNRGA